MVTTTVNTSVDGRVKLSMRESREEMLPGSRDESSFAARRVKLDAGPKNPISESKL